MNDDTRDLSRLYRHLHSERPDCPESAGLARLAAGRAWPWQRRAMRNHLAECSTCADDFRALIAVRDGLAQQIAQGLGPDARSAGHPGRLALLGTAASLAVVIAVVLVNRPIDDRAAPTGAADTIFASNFDNGRAETRRGDTLFRSDFDSREGSKETG